jgi:hypothetical protein
LSEAPGFDLAHDVLQVADAAGEATDAGHCEHVALRVAGPVFVIGRHSASRCAAIDHINPAHETDSFQE